MQGPLSGVPELYVGYRHPETDAPTQPNPKQALAHASLADEIFFGGAAGPGKSEWIIQDAIKTCLQYPRVEVAIFRRTLIDLQRSLIPRFHRHVPRKVARFHGGLLRGEFANGSLCWFCYCQKDADVFNYQSAEWAALYVDEGSHLTGYQLDYLRTRVRSPRPGVRMRVGIGSNPGNRGHQYLKKRYVKPGGYELGGRPSPGYMQIWRPFPDPEKPWVIPKTRVYIPARLDDNPWLTLANPNYLSELWSQQGAIALQLAEGDWDASDTTLLPEWRDQQTVKPGSLISELYQIPAGTTIPWHVIAKPGWRPPRGTAIYGSVDYGYGAPWAFHLHAMLPGGHVRTFFEIYQSGVRDEEQARQIVQVLERETYSDGVTPLAEGIEWVIGEPVMENSRKEHNVEKSIAEVYRDEFGSLTQLLIGVGGRAVRVRRVQRWKAALATNPDGLPNWTITTSCPAAIETVPALNKDENDPEVEDEDGENHCYEGIGRFLEARPFEAPLPKKSGLEHLDALSRQHHLDLQARTAEKKKRGGIARSVAEG